MSTITKDSAIVGVLKHKSGLTAREIADILGREAHEVLDRLEEMDGVFVASYTRDRVLRWQL